MLNLGALYTLFWCQKLNKVLTKTHDEILFYERNVGPINFSISNLACIGKNRLSITIDTRLVILFLSRLWGIAVYIKGRKIKTS